MLALTSSGLCNAARISRLRVWKYAVQSVASFLSVHGMCQIAAPGSVTVGNPCPPARREYSESSCLMNSGSGRPVRSMTSRGNRHIHQPL